jgi:hypothetical protein
MPSLNSPSCAHALSPLWHRNRTGKRYTSQTLLHCTAWNPNSVWNTYKGPATLISVGTLAAPSLYLSMHAFPLLHMVDASPCTPACIHAIESLRRSSRVTEQ